MASPAEDSRSQVFAPMEVEDVRESMKVPLEQEAGSAPGRASQARASGGTPARRSTLVSSASRRSRPSLLKPEGNEFRAPPPREVGPLVEAVLFFIFMSSRAIHPMIVEASTSKEEHFTQASTVTFECIVSLAAGQAIAWVIGGKPEWKRIWRSEPMVVFSIIGALFGLSDIIELWAVGKAGGSLYQVFMQSKLFVTALFMYALKGTKQSRLQCILLTMIMLTVLAYTFAKEAGKKNSGDQSNLVLGIALAGLKVFVSCLTAVLSDKYMKEFKTEPIYMQIVRMKSAWCVVLLLYSFVDGETWGGKDGAPFFHDWNWKAWAMVATYLAKTWLTLYLLALLDSLLKNVAEAGSLLGTYLLGIFLGMKDKEGKTKVFEMDKFTMLMAVVVAVVAYIDAKEVVEKARGWDDEHPLG